MTIFSCFFLQLLINNDTMGKANLVTFLHVILIMYASVVAWFADSGTWGNGCDGHGGT